jgi:hypothetical protein
MFSTTNLAPVISTLEALVREERHLPDSMTNGYGRALLCAIDVLKDLPQEEAHRAQH